MKRTGGFITSLDPGEIFIFGSNLAGRHGAGAALTAKRLFQAKTGVGEGPTGQCYAIPTKDKNISTMSLSRINAAVLRFLEYAKLHPELTFYVTEIGCGLAGLTPKDIGPMFAGASANVILPEKFKAVINDLAQNT